MAIDRRDAVKIPSPPGLPLLGNILDLRGEVPILKLGQLGQQYGEIFSLNILNRKVIFVSSQELMNELCDEKHFEKSVSAILAQVRGVAGRGLFTADNDDEEWHIAHRVLVPAFGPLNIHDMFDSMKDIASQLVLKWVRYGADNEISPAKDFTRLTLDTLSLSCMDYRFNSFYKEEMHPFVAAMVNFLGYASIRGRRPEILHSFFRADEARWVEDTKYMRNLADQLVQQRIDNPKPETKDLLNAMVSGKDPKTGKKLSRSSVIDNMITFLIAGHETTSGMLSFVFYYLLKNPDAYRKAQREVDEVVGNESVRAEHLNKLPYINAVLREASRLSPTAPAFAMTPRSPEGKVLGGKYFIEKGEDVIAILHNIHRDPAVYGDDAEEFRPERMLDENFNKLPPNSWKPFGNGARGCIGRPFAWQEMLLVVSMLLQYFNFTLSDPQYQLEIESTLTIKPKNFFMRADLRKHWTPREIEKSLTGSIRGPSSSNQDQERKGETKVASDNTGKPLTILYGSNSGTCEAFAQTLAADAGSHGFKVTKVGTLDSAKQSLPTEEPVVIITASYEGEPTDNAAHFYDWLQNLPSGEKLETNFAVFGCGHSDWKQTFHRIPNRIDQLLDTHGGSRVCPIGLTNAAKGDMLSDFQNWEDQILWPALREQFLAGEGEVQAPTSIGQSVSIEVFSKRASTLRSDVAEAKVISNKTLSAPGVPQKDHIEIQLPSSTTYRAGDYCAILPLNPPDAVHRVMTRFSLPWDSMLKITSRTGTALPTDHPISAQDLFSAYLELSTPATRRNINMLVQATSDEDTNKALQSLLTDEQTFNSEITDKRISLLALLERFPKISLPLSAFVASLIPMRVRQYSISSSPLSNPGQLTLTYAILDEPSISGEGRHVGVASNYLSNLRAGDITHVAIRPSHAAFHLPTDAEHTPLILVAAGSGIAPFRGFIQERAAQIGASAGRRLAPAHLYFGCRHPDKDDLYREELSFWESIGAVTVHRAYSHAPELSGNHKHIDEVLIADHERISDLWDDGAKVFVCGGREFGASVKKACLQIAKDKAKAKGYDGSDEHLQAWFERVRNERYSTDVFT